MIYCVVPEELAPELYDRMRSYYADDPNVEVIIDRRKSERRDDNGDDGEHRRELRDRRRAARARRVPADRPGVSA